MLFCYHLTMIKRETIFITLTAVLAVSSLILGVLWYQSTTKPTPQPANPPATTQTDAQKFKKDYPVVADNNPFVLKTLADTIKQLESGTGAIYFGFPECPWCQKYVEYLDQVARQHNVKITYYNIRQIRADNTPEYQKIVNLLQNHGLNTDKNGQPRIFVPELVVVKDGKILSRDNTSSLNDSAKDGTPTEWWNQQRITAIKTKFTEMLKPLEHCGATCNL